MNEVKKCQIIRLLLLPFTCPIGLMIMALTSIQKGMQDLLSDIALKK